MDKYYREQLQRLREGAGEFARRYPAKLPPLGGIEGGFKWHIDLPLCNLIQLEEAGVSQIELSGICTWQQSDDYFSARKLGVNSGRILTGVVLR